MCRVCSRHSVRVCASRALAPRLGARGLSGSALACRAARGSGAGRHRASWRVSAGSVRCRLSLRAPRSARACGLGRCAALLHTIRTWPGVGDRAHVVVRRAEDGIVSRSVLGVVPRVSRVASSASSAVPVRVCCLALSQYLYSIFIRLYHTTQSQSSATHNTVRYRPIIARAMSPSPPTRSGLASSRSPHSSHAASIHSHIYDIDRKPQARSTARLRLCEETYGSMAVDASPRGTYQPSAARSGPRSHSPIADFVCRGGLLRGYRHRAILRPSCAPPEQIASRTCASPRRLSSCSPYPSPSPAAQTCSRACRPPSCTCEATRASRR